MAELEETLRMDMMPYAIEKAENEGAYNIDNKIVVEIPFSDVKIAAEIADVSIEDLTPTNYREIFDNISGKGYPGHYDKGRKTMVFVVDSDRFASSPIDVRNAESIREVRKESEEFNRKNQEWLAKYQEAQSKEDLTLSPIEKVAEKTKNAYVGSFQNLARKITDGINRVLGKEQPAQEKVSKEPKKPQGPPEMQAVPKTSSPIMPEIDVIKATPPVPVLPPIQTPAVMPTSSPIILMPMLLSQIEKTVGPAFSDKWKKNPFAGKSYVVMAEGMGSSTVPRDSDRNEIPPYSDRQRKTVNATVPGLMGLPQEAGPAPGGTSGGRKAPVSITLVQVQRNLNRNNKAAITLSPITSPDIQGHAFIRLADVNLGSNLVSGNRSPTTWGLPTHSAWVQAVQMLVERIVGSSNNVVVVVPSESLEVVNSFDSSYFGNMGSNDRTSASWFVSELGRLFIPFSVREAEASSPVVEQKTARSTSSDEENAGSRSKAVSVGKYSEKDTYVENVGTDRSTLIAILEKVDQEARLRLKLYGSSKAKAVEQSYGLAKHKADRAGEESPVSGSAALGPISSGT
ncbi:MAG: hypothetical protein KAS66_05810, partial [Candidatus Omnitrophica bacterium]|nr:hypothetical protein [Candidatus Omnitrophota bacterium]